MGHFNADDCVKEGYYYGSSTIPGEGSPGRRSRSVTATPSASYSISSYSTDIFQMEKSIRNKLRITSPVFREFVAEFLGTFILVVFGDGSVAQSVLTGAEKGDFFSINWGWGVAVMLGVLVSGGVSGGHLNPAVTLAMAIVGKHPWKKVLHYWLAQYLGAIVAAACVLGIYSEGIYFFEGGDHLTVNKTAGIFATYPHVWTSTAGGLADQILGTMLLLLVICAITDPRNMNVAKNLIPLYVGFTILGVGVCFGVNCGYALNPARDLAPRLLTLIGGWGPEVFSANNFWFWVPVVGPHVGAILGVFIYVLCIEIHWPEDDDLDAKAKAKEQTIDMESL